MRIYLFFLILICCFCNCSDCPCPTVWAENYTEARWRQIQIGMDTNQVKHIIGEPLWQDTFFLAQNRANRMRRDSFEIYWAYSNDSLGGETLIPYCECWQDRHLYFDSLWLVKNIIAEIRYD